MDGIYVNDGPVCSGARYVGKLDMYVSDARAAIKSLRDRSHYVGTRARTCTYAKRTLRAIIGCRLAQTFLERWVPLWLFQCYLWG